jgi:serine/threonine protein kinase
LKAYALDVLNGLVEIHKNNVIHCDIKPQNFLLFYNNEDKEENLSHKSDFNSLLSFDPDSYLKITDFGLSHIIPFEHKKAYMKLKCGTFGYSAPEITKVNYN